MPVTMLQLLVFLLAINVVGRGLGALALTAYIVPFSSPMAMIAYGAQSETLWPHLLALAWQALWVVLIIRVSSRLFRRPCSSPARPAPSSRSSAQGATGEA